MISMMRALDGAEDIGLAVMEIGPDTQPENYSDLVLPPLWWLPKANDK